MNDSVESRVSRLEERLAWFERHATEQDRAMLELNEAMDRLKAELAILRDRASQGSSRPELPEDERPPHY